MVVFAAQSSRSQRRAFQRDEKNKRQLVCKRSSSISNFVRRAVFREQFENLQLQADWRCVSSNDIAETAPVVGRLLSVTIKAVTLEEMEVEEPGGFSDHGAPFMLKSIEPI